MNKSFEELLEYIKSNTSSEFDELLVKAKEEDKKRNIWFWSLAIIIDAFLLIFRCRLLYLCYLNENGLILAHTKFYRTISYLLSFFHLTKYWIFQEYIP